MSEGVPACAGTPSASWRRALSAMPWPDPEVRHQPNALACPRAALPSEGDNTTATPRAVIERRTSSPRTCCANRETSARSRQGSGQPDRSSSRPNASRLLCDASSRSAQADLGFASSSRVSRTEPQSVGTLMAAGSGPGGKTSSAKAGGSGAMVSMQRVRTPR